LFLLLLSLQLLANAKEMAKIREWWGGERGFKGAHNDRPGLGNLIELFPIEMAKTLRVLALMSDSK